MTTEEDCVQIARDLVEAGLVKPEDEEQAAKRIEAKIAELKNAELEKAREPLVDSEGLRITSIREE